MTKETKFFIAVGIVTLLILVGAAVFLSGTPAPATSEPADKAILMNNIKHQTASTSAQVTIVEFADLQCPACASAHPIIKKVVADYDNKVNFIFRHFPLAGHKNAKVAAYAVEAAAAQNKFWEMQDLLYTRQAEWETNDKPEVIFLEYAKELKLDEEKFSTAVKNKEGESTIQADYDDGIRLGVNSTPTIFINGMQQASGMSEADFKAKIDAELTK